MPALRTTGGGGGAAPVMGATGNVAGTAPAETAAECESDALLERILSSCGVTELGRMSCACRLLHRLAQRRIASLAASTLLRAPRQARGATERVSPDARRVLPALCERIDEMHAILDEGDGTAGGGGGYAHAVVVDDPVLHIAQHRDDFSCGYRSTQMMLSYVLANEGVWPGGRRVLLDDESRRLWERTPEYVPSVARLRCALEQAWRDGVDPEGMKQLEGTTACDPADWDDDNLPAKPTPKQRERGDAPTYACVPQKIGGLRQIGPTDVWALTHWIGAMPELHDFLSAEPEAGEAGEGGDARPPTLAWERTFSFLESHFSRHAPPRTSASKPTLRCRCAPVMLQWDGHSVVAVGTVVRRASRGAPLEHHVLLLNAASTTDELMRSLARRPPIRREAVIAAE